MAYKKLAGDEDDDAALNHAGLGIQSRDLVLDLLERKRLFGNLSEALHERGALQGTQHDVRQASR